MSWPAKTPGSGNNDVRTRRPRLLPAILIALLVLAVAWVAIAATLLRGQKTISDLTGHAGTVLLPQVHRQLRIAVNLERLRGFGESVRSGATVRDRRAARLAAQLLTADTALGDDSRLKERVEEVFSVIREIERRRAEEDTVRRQMDEKLARIDAALEAAGAPGVAELLALRLKTMDALVTTGPRALDSTEAEIRRLVKALAHDPTVGPAAGELVAIADGLGRLIASHVEVERRWTEARRVLDEENQRFSTDAAVTAGQAMSNIGATAERSTTVLVIGLAGYTLVALLAAGLLQVLVVRPILRVTRRLEQPDAPGEPNPPPAGEWLRELHDISVAACRFQRAHAESEHLRAEAEVARRAAQESARAKSAFFAVLSEEVRTPLNAMLGLAQNLASDPGTPLTPTQQRHVNALLHGGERLQELTRDIMDLARIEAGQLTATIESVVIGPVIAACLAQIAPTAAERRIILVDATGDTSGDRVLADAGRLRQVLLTLLGNAIRCRQDGSTLILRTVRLADGHLRLQVGTCAAAVDVAVAAGITPGREATGRSSGAAAATPVPMVAAGSGGGVGVGDSPACVIEGAGVGMALAYRLIVLMGGRMGFDSSERDGIAFWWTLPLSERPADSAGDVNDN